MGLTASQDIKPKQEEKSEWTFRRLFPLGAISTLSKSFTTPFDVLLGFVVIVLGISELIGQHVSLGMWGFAVLLLIANLFERNKYALLGLPPEEKIKK